MSFTPDSPPLLTIKSSKFDIRVENHFTLFLVHPISNRARVWLNENVQADALWSGGALVVEPRYLTNLVEGMKAGGLTLVREQRRGEA